MRTGVTVYLSPTDRKGLGTATIMRTAGVSKTAVWRWQERFMSEGVDGLLHDKTRPARIARLTDDVAERIVALTLGEPPGETTHWTGRVMAKAAGVSLTRFSVSGGLTA